MRYNVITVVSVCALLAAGSALAQAQTSQATSSTTTSDIICKMSGTCGDTYKPDDSGKIKVQDEKMFSLQKPGAQQAASPPSTDSSIKLQAEKVFSLQKPGSAAASQPVAATHAHGAKASSQRWSVKAPAAPAQNSMTMQVRFEAGSADLTPDAKVELDKYVSALKSPELTSMKFTVAGHTDSSGVRAKNIDLSQRRAQSVVDYLVAGGVTNDRLNAQGFGPDKPMTGTSKRSPVNRRVELLRAD